MIRRLILGLLLVIFAALFGGGWYAYDKGFTKKWRNFVTHEFRKRGVEVSLRRLKLHPLRGIVARELKVYDARDHKRLLAVVDEMRLIINYSNLIQGKTFLDAIELRDARLDLPLNPEKPRGAKIEIERLSGQLFLAPHQAYLSRLEADVYGVHVTASGRLINPQAFRPPTASKPAIEAREKWYDRAVGELKKFAFIGPSPTLDLRFSGDLARPEKLIVEARLHASKVQRAGYQIESLEAGVAFRDGLVELKQFALHDRHGALRASGRYETSSREAAAVVQSNLDLPGFARAFTRTSPLEEVVAYQPPSLELAVQARLDEKPHILVTGHVKARQFAFRSVTFEGLEADGSWDGSRWSARDIKLVHRSGEITGDVMHLPEQLRSRLKNSIHADVLKPLLTGKLGEWFSRFEFVQAPSLELQRAGLLLDERAVAPVAATPAREFQR